MKRIFLTLFLTSITSTLFCLPTGNPGEAYFYPSGVFTCDSFPFCLTLRTGFYGDYVFNRYMQLDEPSNHSGIEKTENYTNGGILTVNFSNLIDLYGIIGNSKTSILTSGNSLIAGFSPYVEIATKTDFSWGVGGRISYPLCFGGIVGIEGEYFRARLPISYIRRENTGPAYIDGLNLNRREWQVACGYTHLFCSPDQSISFAPYATIQWAGARIGMDHARVQQAFNFVLPDLKNRQYTGYTVGISFIFYEMSSISVEGRFADELALSVQGQIRF